MGDVGAFFSGTIGMVVIVIGIVWGILLLLIPFIIFSISSTLKRIDRTLVQIKQHQMQFIEAQAEKSDDQHPAVSIIPD